MQEIKPLRKEVYNMDTMELWNIYRVSCKVFKYSNLDAWKELPFYFHWWQRETWTVLANVSLCEFCHLSHFWPTYLHNIDPQTPDYNVGCGFSKLTPKMFVDSSTRLLKASGSRRNKTNYSLLFSGALSWATKQTHLDSIAAIWR